ncbi:protein arginine kinase [Clostridium sp. YIM B02515]|uniref:Protein-arginine kinase n=1 Tax=Clostridium rhizosphaerae TaxID=2803861 RepID=A0ABS1TI54_9CLOT|nr:protein arginine kinase [Clostridium rhizosphaerae]MBL4938467.1 protein arginine kinase [Clostridium rhizosphaerae]
MKNWIKADDNYNVVLSSRIRLARNLREIPFPDKLSEETGKDIVKNIEDAFYSSSYTEENYKSKYLWMNEELTNRAYYEKHLISHKLLGNYKKSAFILDNDEVVSIMLNEEDHIRLQCITSGFNLDETYDLANKLDNLLEEKLDYAFDEKLGYLTACPTNIGTGLRASVMLHLPALSMNNEMVRILNVVGQVGMTIRGLFGEGSKAEGDLYQISNQVTLGLSEEEIINNLKAVVAQIIDREQWSRQQLMKGYKYELQDKVYRSLGVLRSAVLLNSEECLNLISNVRMGVEMGIIKDVDVQVLNSLLVETQPATLQLISNAKLSEKDRDFSRAKLLRKSLGGNDLD